MKKHKKDEEDYIEEDKFKAVYQSLRSFRRLSDEEAKVFIEILKRKKVSIKDVKNILELKNLKITTTKPYTMLRNLEDQDLVFEEKSASNEKIYCAINPRDLMMDIAEEIKGLDIEITLLESEEPEFIREEILEEPQILETDYEITDAISNLISKEYEIEFYYDEFSIKQNDMIFKRLIKRFSLNPIKGTFSAVFATKKGERIFPYVVIVFSINHKINKKNSTVIGCKIVNPEVCKCLKGGVRSE